MRTARVESMYKAIYLQMGMVLAVVAILAGWLGSRGAVSGFIGGMAYLMPNLLFAVRLRMLAASGRAGVAGFITGELLKLVGTVAILAMAQRWVDVHWLAMLIGLFAALQANLFAFLLKT